MCESAPCWRLRVKTKLDRQRLELQVELPAQASLAQLYQAVLSELSANGTQVDGTEPRLFFKGRAVDRSPALASGAGLEDGSVLQLVLGAAVEPPPGESIGVGEPVETLWGDGNWYAAIVINRESDGSYWVKWAGEHSHSKGVRPECIRRRVEEPVTIELPALGPEATTRALQTALEDDQFKQFLQGELFQTMFGPIKEMIASHPSAVGPMLERLGENNPSMLATLLPFVPCELESSNPALFNTLSARFGACPQPSP